MNYIELKNSLIELIPLLENWKNLKFNIFNLMT